MHVFIGWIANNPMGFALSILVFILIVLLIGGGIQGRAISLWPPRMEGRPLKNARKQAGTTGVLDAIRKRKSVRAFQDKLVEEEKLNLILEAVRLAPSASNRQEWRFVVVKNAETRKKVASAASSVVAFIDNAPVLLVACAETNNHVMECGQLSYPIDVAIAVDHLTLAAVDQGLGTCWVAMFNEKKVKEILGIPADIRVVALMPLGYPSDPAPVEKRRLTLEKIIKYEHW
jgi:nitroreductase